MIMVNNLKLLKKLLTDNLAARLKQVNLASKNELLILLKKWILIKN